MKKIKAWLRNKKGFEFKSAFFAIIAMGMFILAINLWVTEWNSSYNSGLGPDFEEYNRLDEISSQVSRQQGNISVVSSVTGEDFEGTSIRATFGILNNIYSSFNMVFGRNGMIASITKKFNIPSWVGQGIIAMMVVAITFTLIAILFRRDKA